MKTLLASVAVAALFCAPVPSVAQTEQTASAEESAASDAEALLSAEELQDMVAPVALYPDTLLIQVLVAATFPLEVVKADRLVQDNADSTPEELQATVDAEGWDDSVAVLAVAFPDVLADMAVHVEWTEALGTAMLAQSDDVMDAVQDMRLIANENGALQSGDEQTVEVTQDAGEETIIIQPTDPEVVYVPQYDQEVVYVESGTNTGDLVAAGLITFGTVALINEIFNDNNYWHGYWGCRSCGGWGGGPIINNPRNVNINGDVNIGTRPGAGWKPDDRRRDKARDDIARKRGPDGGTNLPTHKQDRGDEMRRQLSRETGAADIARPGADRSGVKRPETGAAARHKPAVDRTKASSRPQGSAKSRPNVHKPTTTHAATRKPAASSGGALKQRAPAQRTNAGASRGRASSGGHRGGGRKR